MKKENLNQLLDEENTKFLNKSLDGEELPKAEVVSNNDYKCDVPLKAL